MSDEAAVNERRTKHSPRLKRMIGEDEFRWEFRVRLKRTGGTAEERRFDSEADATDFMRSLMDELGSAVAAVVEVRGVLTGAWLKPSEHAGYRRRISEAGLVDPADTKDASQ